MQRPPLRFSLAAAFCALNLVFGAPVLAQGAGGPAAQADAPAAQVAPTADAQEDAPGVVAESQPASSDVPDRGAQEAGAGAAQSALPDKGSEPADAEPADAATPAAAAMPADAAATSAPEPDPFPSPLADPGGALRWLLTQTEAGSHNLSPIGMYRSADIVVKLVMLGLALASLVTWTVWLAKTLELWGARGRAGRALRLLRRAATLQEAQERLGPGRGVVGRMLAEAAAEVAQARPALDHAGGAGLKERVAAALGRIEAQAGRRMGRGTGVLATIGSTAPFVGLFGTVWGIMNSFISIAESNTTNLAVVAPGIAEALLATALGLVAAIPAVVVYNLFARSIAGYRLLLGHAGERIERLVSRDLDHRLIPEVGPGTRPEAGPVSEPVAAPSRAPAAE